MCGASSPSAGTCWSSSAWATRMARSEVSGSVARDPTGSSAVAMGDDPQQLVQRLRNLRQLAAQVAQLRIDVEEPHSRFRAELVEAASILDRIAGFDQGIQLSAQQLGPLLLRAQAAQRQQAPLKIGPAKKAGLRRDPGLRGGQGQFPVEPLPFKVLLDEPTQARLQELELV